MSKALRIWLSGATPDAWGHWRIYKKANAPLPAPPKAEVAAELAQAAATERARDPDRAHLDSDGPRRGSQFVAERKPGISPGSHAGDRSQLTLTSPPTSYPPRRIMTRLETSMRNRRPSTACTTSQPGQPRDARDRLFEIIRRTEFAMNDTLTPTQKAEIHRLLRTTRKSYSEIAVAVSTESNRVTRFAVANEAYGINKTRPRGRIAGTTMKGIGGRKKGTANRDRAFVLFAVGKTPAQALVAINAELKRLGAKPISRQRVGVFHKEWKKQQMPPTDSK